jgi:hypothetical protein
MKTGYAANNAVYPFYIFYYFGRLFFVRTGDIINKRAGRIQFAHKVDK